MATKTYRVAGQHKQFGYEPGQKFRREIPPGLEALLFASGAIEEVAEKPADPKRAEKSASNHKDKE